DDVLQTARERAREGVGAAPQFEALVGSIRARLANAESQGLCEVLNGTGILLHTNLGRAPLAPEALRAIEAIAGGYSNLEFDLAEGTRGSRYERLGPLLRQATGAEDALVVNNCAAAVLLILDTFARGRDVVVSRNQLIEIGGGFRLPDVLARSGANLVEVGTTNRVYLADFERALGPRTALLLRTHTSNYRVEGFTADVLPADLVALGRRSGVITVEDLGSGALSDLSEYGLPPERSAPAAVADGLDLVAFSGDKLLGGPQAGIIAGRRALVARLRANPLLRALRVDKATLAALAATLRLHLEPGGRERIPLYTMLAQTLEELRARAERLRAVLAQRGIEAHAVTTEAFVGGGTLPLAPIPSLALSLEPAGGDPNALARALRGRHPALVGRCEGRALLLDLRTLPAARDAEAARVLTEALAG
ncbi:MAG TPA: L-seryl-tRNA(Sec) selenium transferase, partial [Candidatus Baltobacteraceae bacterium]|nr:L-seryl-tRNA(Sec) selenium transferase [Candidatus Baltobacteraceae bacterium]